MKKKEDKLEKQYHKMMWISGISIFFSIFFWYIINGTSLLEPKINDTHLRYISFNDSNATDMLRIKNIEKMSDSVGKSKRNSHSLKLDIMGEKKAEYEIILYPLMNNISDQYIYYYLEDDSVLGMKSLDGLDKTDDGGIILYQGEMNNSSMVLRLWISKQYRGKVKDNSFEVKVRPR